MRKRGVSYEFTGEELKKVLRHAVMKGNNENLREKGNSIDQAVDEIWEEKDLIHHRKGD